MDKDSTRPQALLQSTVFQVSKYFGVFPLQETCGKLSCPLPLLAYSSLLIASLYTVIFYQFDYSQVFSSKYLLHSYNIPLLVATASAAVHTFVLRTGSKELSKALEMIRTVSSMTGYRSPPSGNLELYLSAVYVSLIYGYEIYIFGIWINSFWAGAFYVMNAMVFLIGTQFTRFLTVLHNHYDFLGKTLDSRNVFEWIMSHHLLGKCGRVFEQCYSVQIVFCFLSFMLFSLCNIYYNILNKDDIYLPATTLNCLWALFYVSCIYQIVAICRRTELKAKAFKSSLRSLVIRDKSATLVMNKRIILFLEAGKVSGFNASGLFKLDFPLLCSIALTFTTYTCILVQFP